MKKILFILAMLSIPTFLFAQSMKIYHKNGQIIELLVDDLDSVVFTTSGATTPEQLLVGTWKEDDEILNLAKALTGGDLWIFYKFNADGTAITYKCSDEGDETIDITWSKSGNTLTLYGGDLDSEGATMSFVDANTLKIVNGSYEYTLVRVAESEIESVINRDKIDRTTITVDNTGYYQSYNGSCSCNNFSASLTPTDGNSSNIYIEFTLNSLSQSSISVGTDITAYIKNIYIMDCNGIPLGSIDYTIQSGTVKVSSNTSDQLVLQFDNVSILAEMTNLFDEDSQHTYHFNGTITYDK